MTVFGYGVPVTFFSVHQNWKKSFLTNPVYIYVYMYVLQVISALLSVYVLLFWINAISFY